MGRFHRHDDGTAHSHDDLGAGHSHDHEVGHGQGAGHSHAHAHDQDQDQDHGDGVPGAGCRHDHGGGHSHDHAHDQGDDHDHSLGDHSGYQTGRERIEVLERIFDENDAAAAANRARFDQAGLLAINLMSGPGAGKTTLLAQTLAQLSAKVRCGVVEGDIETAIDADRLRVYGAQIALLNTGNGFGGECHLDAPMVAHAIASLSLSDLDLLLIENVGNLVCPAEFDVGAHHRAMVASVTEGEDKPLKYPVMFRAVDVVVVNKIDLLPHLRFDLGLFEHNIRSVNPRAEIIHASALTGQGIEPWISWLTDALAVRPEV